jgi:hypothetical protein
MMRDVQLAPADPLDYLVLVSDLVSDVSDVSDVS